MSFVVNHNTSDTPIPDVSTLDLSRGLINFGADWRSVDWASDELVLTNMNSPVAYPERFRFAVTDVADVYKNTGISATLYSPTRRGSKLLTQLTEVWSVTSTDDATYNVALPVSCHIVLQIPQDPAITASDILTLIGRAVSGMFDTGSEQGDRLAAMMRKALKPSDL